MPLALLALTLFGCSGGESTPSPPDGAKEDALAPDLGQPKPFTQFVMIGDSNAVPAGVHPDDGYVKLLAENDDTRYPAFKRRDLKSLYSRLLVVNQGEGGSDTSAAVRKLEELPPNPEGRTLVIISTGAMEFTYHVLSLADVNTVLAVTALRNDNVRKMVEHFNDKQRYPHGTVVGQLSIIDPTDGMGKLPDGEAEAMGILCMAYTHWAATGTMALHIEANRAASSQLNTTWIDVNKLFAGHAYQHDNPEGPFYDAKDNELWMTDDCFHPNPVGQEKLRQMLWNQLVVPHCGKHPSCRAVP